MEAAGLALGVLGIAGLFKSCIENFDIVVKARNCSVELDRLCAQLSLHRIRLVFWGQTLGLTPDSCVAFNELLSREDIKPAIERVLLHLHLLLQQADLVTERYESHGDRVDAHNSPDDQLQQSAGLNIFRERFELFKARLRRGQDDKSTWMVTRWAIHDLEKFKAVVTNVGELVDGLEGITSSLGVLQRQQILLAKEIDSISDTQSLRLLQQLTSSDVASLSLRLVSETASIRLSFMDDHIPNGTIRSNKTSYYTALSQPGDAVLGYSAIHEELEDNRPTHGFDSQLMNWPWAAEEESSPVFQHPAFSAAVTDPPMPAEQHEALTELHDNEPLNIPQNQRLMAELMKRSTSKVSSQSFDSGSVGYGEALAPVKAHNEEKHTQQSLRLLAHADRGMSAARRAFLELRSLRTAGVPFITASTLTDRLDRLIAGIEGPPDTPYQGGVFWIMVKLLPDPREPPALRFITKIYHPNIDCNGNICADYENWWKDPNLQQYLFGLSVHRQKYKAWDWLSDNRWNRYSLGALLTAICSLLASPNVHDPLVTDIAATYVQDYPRYCENARLYTQRYALPKRPSDADFEAFDEANSVPVVIPEYRASYITQRANPGLVASSAANVRVGGPQSEAELSDYGSCDNISFILGRPRSSRTESVHSTTSEQNCESRISKYDDKFPGAWRTDRSDDSDDDTKDTLVARIKLSETPVLINGVRTQLPMALYAKSANMDTIKKYPGGENNTCGFGNSNVNGSGCNVEDESTEIYDSCKEKLDAQEVKAHPSGKLPRRRLLGRFIEGRFR